MAKRASNPQQGRAKKVRRGTGALRKKAKKKLSGMNKQRLRRA